eukprot:m.306477 g.306477  ORF g.306477 m.306477 type:complete len:247 (+) comp41272_c0_seq1:127-867(+)
MSSEELHGEPPALPGDVAVRIYSMEYCPWAQRTRLALAVKGVKHDVINCNLKERPKFLWDANPNGQVPVILHAGNVIYESEITVEYIDQTFPEGIKLYPEDPGKRARARIVITNFASKVVPAMYKSIREPSEENVTNLVDLLERCGEKPLKALGTPYFGGQQVNTVDVNIWPFLERIDASIQIGVSKPLPVDRFPTLIAYIDRMKSTPGIKDVIHSPADHSHFRKSYMEGKPDYNHQSKNPIYAAA